MKKLWEIWVDWWAAAVLTMIGFRQLPERKSLRDIDFDHE
jgi:hypothetical protein